MIKTSFLSHQNIFTLIQTWPDTDIVDVGPQAKYYRSRYNVATTTAGSSQPPAATFAPICHFFSKAFQRYNNFEYLTTNYKY